MPTCVQQLKKHGINVPLTENNNFNTIHYTT
jgi:hypothetical protein